MPTMSKTLPLPTAVVDRLANRVTAVQPGPEYYGSESNSISLAPQDIKCWAAGVADVSKRQWQILFSCPYSDNKFFLTVRPTTDRDIVWDVKLPSAGNPVETYPWDIQDLADQIPSEQRLTDESEWEEYEEPLWDPMRAEVRSMVREFYEQADADSE